MQYYRGGTPRPNQTFDSVDSEALRCRRSEKWARHPPDVLPSFLAEMDFPLAPEISAVLLGRHSPLASGSAGERLPQIEYHPGQATYLAWLDCRALGLGGDPAEQFLARGRVALTPGPEFGVLGRGFARLTWARRGR